MAGAGLLARPFSALNTPRPRRGISTPLLSFLVVRMSMRRFLGLENRRVRGQEIEHLVDPAETERRKVSAAP